jgi:ATP-binding cassette subfamily B multidrug efflux pump
MGKAKEKVGKLKKKILGDVSETDQRTRQYKDSVIFKRLIQYVLNYKGKIVQLLMLSILQSISGLGYPLLMAMMAGEIQKVIANPELVDQIWLNVFTIGMILICVVIFNFFVKWRYHRGMGMLSLLAISKLRSDLFQHIQSLSLKYYSNRPVGKVMSTLTNDVESVNNLVSNAIIQLIGDVITITATITILITTSYQLTFYILAFLPLIGGVVFVFARKSREYWRKTRQTVSLITTLLQESITGSKTIKAFVTEDQNIESFDLANRADRDVNLSAARLQAFLSPIIQIMIALILGFVLIQGANLVQNGDLTIEKLVRYFLLASGFTGPMGNLANFYNTLQLAMAGGERILTTFDIKPDIVEIPKPVIIEKIQGYVEFRNLSFYYEEGVAVLKDISVSTKPNERVAFVGFTGAGKTTLISLLSRFYDPQEGEITIDGVNIKDLSLESLRSQMGIVLQDTYLFSGTVMDNIRYGRPSATDDDVIEAATRVGAHKFILKLVDGYKTEVRERGSLLSVGQRQLISFARALLADPRILILDEATSSVDPYTEIKIQEALETLLQGRNSFIIAHRLSTILNSDKICVLEHGKIVQQGSHDELVSQEGLYKHLYEMQFKRPAATLDEVKEQIIKEREKSQGGTT